MSYTTIWRCAHDTAFANRVAACYAQEGADQPENAAVDNMWAIASATDIEQAYESAVIAENPNPGGDPAVITDGAILAKVQANPPAASP